MEDVGVVPCTGCGRPTRYQRSRPREGVLVRVSKGPGVCSACAGKGKHPERLRAAVRVRDEPLTADEETVLRLVQRKCGDDAVGVAELLGLTREEVSA